MRIRLFLLFNLLGAMMAWGQNDSLAPISMPIKEGDSIITIQADTVKVGSNN